MRNPTRQAVIARDSSDGAVRVAHRHGLLACSGVALLLLAVASCSTIDVHAAMPAGGTAADFLDRQLRLASLGDRGSFSKQLQDGVFSGGFEHVPLDCSADRDADGVPDCAESASGVFVDIADTGTDPDNADTDGDGLSDGDEVFGSAGGLDLPALGVHPLRRDLLIEYDWFDDARDCGEHGHAPSADVLARVAAVFAASPVVNPDGSTGIHLIQDAGQGGALIGGNRVDGHDSVLPGGLDDTHALIKQENFAAERQGYFHRVLLAHRYGGGSTSSGYAELVGDDVIISLACQNSDDLVARTIMHELGHNLGLHHGGFEACNGKPNYNSLLNYRYQFSGLDDLCEGSGRELSSEGYSDGSRPSLDEAALDEFAGVCGGTVLDWNRDGLTELAISHDLNPGFEGTCDGSALGTLADFDDWANITLLGILDASGQLKGIQQQVACEVAPASKG